MTNVIERVRSSFINRTNARGHLKKANKGLTLLLLLRMIEDRL